MNSLKQEILFAFDSTGWTESHSQVKYQAISKTTNDRLKKLGLELHKASTIERVVRMLKKDGLLERTIIEGELHWRKI